MVVATGAGAADAAGGLQARVMVLPTEGKVDGDARLAGDVSEALMRGARRATPNVARATASLADTAVIVGCDPSERPCVDAVAAALNVDQMLLAKVSSEGAGASVEVTAVSRESAPVSRRFPVRGASRRQDLATIEAAVPGMLDAEYQGGDAPPPPPDDRPPPDGRPPPDDRPPPDGPVDGTPLGPPGGGDEPGRGFSPRAPMYLAIGGGALVVGGLAFWGLAAAKQGAIDDAPDATADDLAALEALEARGRTYATVGNVLVVGGAAIGAAGAVWWWKTRGRTPATATITPVVTPGGAAVLLEGRW